MTRTCPICGEEFVVNLARKVHKYCSKTCARRAGARRQTARKTAARKAARRPRLCVVCGTEFVPTRATNRYCSPKCSRLMERGRELARRARRRIEARKPKVCPVCGEEFMPRKRRQKFCSRRCANSTRVSERKPTVCPVCGQTFIPSAKHPETRYCSRSCASRGNAAAVRLPARKCEWCGKEFEPRAPWQRFCSTSCRRGAKYGRERQGGAGRAALPVDEAKVRAYLSLPPAERYARRKELTKAEHKLAEKIYNQDHASRCVAVNW